MSLGSAVEPPLKRQVSEAGPRARPSKPAHVAAPAARQQHQPRQHKHRHRARPGSPGSSVSHGSPRLARSARIISILGGGQSQEFRSGSILLKKKRSQTYTR